MFYCNEILFQVAPKFQTKSSSKLHVDVDVVDVLEQAERLYASDWGPTVPKIVIEVGLSSELTVNIIVYVIT